MILICGQGADGLSAEQVSSMRVAAAFVVAMAEEMVSDSDDLFAMDVLLSLPQHSIKRLTTQARRYARYLGISTESIDRHSLDDYALAACIAIAFPENIALRREGSGEQQSFKLAGGKGAIVNRHTLTSADKWLTVLDGQQRLGDVTISLAQPIEQSLLELLFPAQFKQHKMVTLNSQTHVMEYRLAKRFFAIELESMPASGEEKSKNTSYWNEATVKGWEQYLSELPFDRWPLQSGTLQWWNRVKLASKLALPQNEAYDEPTPWPNSIQNLLPEAIEMLRDKLAKCVNVKQLEKVDWHSALNNTLTWPQQSALKSLLPEYIDTPNGRKIKLRYESDGRVIASTRLQDMFGQQAPVNIALGNITVMFELLSPARRPIQTTSDLGAFWQGSYKEVQKEMKGRYPKHNWDLPD